MKEVRVRDNFCLREFRISVDVCGQTYYAKDSYGNVSNQIEHAFAFNKFGAQRVAMEFFKDSSTEIQEIKHV
jgi:hypothetical protein